MNRRISFGAFFLLLPACAGMAFAAEEPQTLKIGARAPDFTLPGVDGRDYSLADFASAEVLVIVFTCNHCPTAQAYEDRIQQLSGEFKDKGVALVAISPNDPLALRLDELGYTDLGDSFEDMKIRAKDKKFTFPYLYDGDEQAVSKAFGPVSTPHAFVFDKKRELRYVGRIDDSESVDRVTSPDLRNAIEAVLAGGPAPIETTKTVGCSIKWSDKRGSVQESLDQWAQKEVTIEPIDEAGVRALVKNDSKNYRLINVWATWCGPCVVEFPSLIEISRMYSTREFEVVTISADRPDAAGKALEFLKTQRASTKNYIFSLEDTYKLIEAVDPGWQGALPYTMFVAPGGEVVFKQMGQIDPLEVKRQIVAKLGRVFGN